MLTLIIVLTIICIIYAAICASNERLSIEGSYGIAFAIFFIGFMFCSIMVCGQATQKFGKPIDISNIENINVGFDVAEYKATKGSRAFVEYTVTVTHPTKPFPLLKHFVDKGQFDLKVLHNVADKTASILANNLPVIVVDGVVVIVEVRYVIYLPSKTTTTRG